MNDNVSVFVVSYPVFGNSEWLNGVVFRSFRGGIFRNVQVHDFLSLVFETVVWKRKMAAPTEFNGKFVIYKQRVGARSEKLLAMLSSFCDRVRNYYNELNIRLVHQHGLCYGSGCDVGLR